MIATCVAPALVGFVIGCIFFGVLFTLGSGS